MVRHQHVNGAVGQPQANGIPVTLLTQGRLKPHAAVKVSDVGIRQVQAVDADITSYRQALRFGLGHQGHTRRTADAAQVNACTGGAYEFKNHMQRNGLCRHRHAAQTQPRGQSAAGSNAFAKVNFLRAKPDTVAKTGCVLQCTHQHLGIGDRHFCLAKTDTTGFSKLDHFGQGLALQTACQCT